MHPQYTSIRIRPELRAAQVERARLMTPALTLYFEEKYDLGATVIPSSFQKVSLWECLRILATTEAKVLEVPEPLWLRFGAKNLLLSAVWKGVGLVRRQPRITVAYAIENNDLANLISPARALHPFIEVAARTAAGFLIRFIVDRFAFGSLTSKNLYHSLKGTKKIPYQLIEELPAAASLNPLGLRDESGPRAIFVGELDDRKGILDLIDAWPTVERNVPQVSLTIVGAGKHSDFVSKWCREEPSSRIYAGFVQHKEAARLIADSDILVAPSRRAGRWREQIGLPIVEGLSAGLTVVTTDETGLAAWLTGNGHTVLAEASVRRDLPGALVRALQEPLQRDAVLAALPETPGRIAADAWLHALCPPNHSKDCDT